MVYGASLKTENLTLNSLLNSRNRIVQALGTTKRISLNNSEDFRKAIEKYADSTNTKTELAYWPIVKRICIKGPWECLKSGAVLVDAPGIRDDNSARGKKKKKTIFIFLICSPIKRCCGKEIPSRW